jgi:predicted porin
MQKKIIAAAVAGLLAAPAFAQTNVTISGNFRAGWESYKLSSCTPGFSCRSESRVSDQSSGLRFNVVEDLGGGLKAWGQLDYRGALDLGGLGNTGNSGVGFMGDKWGKFTLGRWDVHYNEVVGLEATRASSLQGIVSYGLFSQVNGTTIANGTRTPNLLMWDSPNWNGFTGRLAYSTSFAANEGSGRGTSGAGNPGGGNAWTGALRYNNGPWAAGLSYWNADGETRHIGTATAPNTKNDQTSTRLWLGYTFGMGLKLGIAWDRSKLDNGQVQGSVVAGIGTTRRTAWMIPVSYAFGAHKIYGVYSRAGRSSGSAIAAGTGGDYKATQWMIGYDYAMSKRTAVGVYYTKLNNNRNATNTAGGSYDMFALGANGATATSMGEDARQLYVGMNHTF